MKLRPQKLNLFIVSPSVPAFSSAINSESVVTDRVSVGGNICAYKQCCHKGYVLNRATVRDLTVNIHQ